MAENLKIIDLPPARWAFAARCAAKLVASGKDRQTFPPTYWRDPAITIINWEGDLIARAELPVETAEGSE